MENYACGDCVGHLFGGSYQEGKNSATLGVCSSIFMVSKDNFSRAEGGSLLPYSKRSYYYTRSLF